MPEHLRVMSSIIRDLQGAGVDLSDEQQMLAVIGANKHVVRDRDDFVDYHRDSAVTQYVTLRHKRREEILGMVFNSIKQRGTGSTILESVVNGVPLIAWPLYAEQKMIAMMLTEDIKVALRPKPSENGLGCRDEIARVVKGLMEGDEGKAAKVLSEEGSSTKALSEVT
ncbi:UDP-glucuronosyl/UDP-glucosyltransferase [Corchorus olitorius]|uniref:UDP-glucuronosyl/UDP-glucosyltransferase n=1 Tax=Corchorus olitorius TaxID=93759 RepID=A0A1R3KDN4_9ROSI|nr:UDP-glucuronosyl/UDP-glucosyltransferase [Corchorus olitorius]